LLEHSSVSARHVHERKPGMCANAVAPNSHSLLILWFALLERNSSDGRDLASKSQPKASTSK